MALGKTRAQLLAEISSQELSDWLVYHRIEPFGGQIQFIGHAITAMTVANANRSKKTKPYKLKDFMPDFEKGEQSLDDMLNIASLYTAGLGGEDLRGA